MIARLTVDEVAKATKRHPVTVRRALEAGELHGVQAERIRVVGSKTQTVTAGGHWRIREDCAEAWADRVPCEHQKANVTDIRRRA